MFSVQAIVKKLRLSGVKHYNKYKVTKFERELTKKYV